MLPLDPTPVLLTDWLEPELLIALLELPGGEAEGGALDETDPLGGA